MYEEDLKILDSQIERAKQNLKLARNETAKYEIEKRLKVYLDMRLDLLIQIENYRGQK